MTYDTGNPVPSTDPRDLYDNAANMDLAMNSGLPTFTDRLGVLRKTWAALETEFQAAQEGRENQFDLLIEEFNSQWTAFLIGSGFTSLGNYGAGITLNLPNEFVIRDGYFWRINLAEATLPYTTTGNWAIESVNFVLIGDDVLRQDLANGADPLKGANMVAFGGITVQEAIEDRLQLIGGSLTGAINLAPEVALSSASTVDIGAAASNTVEITGSVTITAFDNFPAGARRLLRFSGTPVLTHSAALTMPTAANVTAAAGDFAEFLSMGSGNWKCIGYMRADGSALGVAVPDASTSTAGITRYATRTEGAARAATDCAVTPDALDAALEALPVPVFKQEYVSVWASPTLGALQSYSHGMGVAPIEVFVERRCTMADGTIYVPNDVLDLPTIMQSVGSGVGCELAYDASDLKLRFGNLYIFTIKSASTVAYATVGRWEVRVRARFP